MTWALGQGDTKGTRMKIGLAADSHDNLPMIRKAIQLFQERRIKHILHLGDYIAPFAVKEWVKFKGEIVGVFGNNDGERAGINKVLATIVPPPHLFEFQDRRILAVHDEKEIDLELTRQADVIVAAHTHEPEMRKGAPLFVNPGECGGWLSGKGTVALLDLDTLEVEIIPF